MRKRDYTGNNTEWLNTTCNITQTRKTSFTYDTCTAEKIADPNTIFFS